MREDGTVIDRLIYASPFLLLASYTAVGSFIHLDSFPLRLLSFLATLILPAFYLARLVSRELGLGLDEFLAVDAILGAVLLKFTYVYLTTFLGEVTRLHVMLSLTVLSTASFILDSRMGGDYPPKPPEHAIKPILLLVSFLFGLAIVSRSLPFEFWRGADPWEAATVSRAIAELSLSPSQAVEYFYSYVHLDNSGFYYLISSVSVVTGLSVDSVLRFGGPVLAGAASTLTYLVAKRVYSPLSGLVASFLLFTNYYIYFRFSSPLRENLGVLYLLAIILLFESVRDSSRTLKPGTVASFALLFGGCLVTHILTPFMVVGVVSVHVLRFLASHDNKTIRNVGLGLAAAVLIPWMYLGYLLYPLKFFLKTNTAVGVSALVILAALAVTLYILRRSGFEVSSIGRNNPKKAVLSVELVFYLVFLVSLLFPPFLGEGFEFECLSFDLFSDVVLIAAFVGLLVFRRASRLSFVGLGSLLAVFMALSYFGVEVPLNRFSVYIAFILCVKASSVFAGMNPGAGFGSGLSVQGLRDVVVRNRVYLVLLLLVVSMSLTEVQGLPRFYTTFTERDIEATKGFVETLSAEDLVIADEVSEHLLYYVDTPRENLVTLMDDNLWLNSFLNSSTPYELSEQVATQYPEKTRLRLFMKNDYYWNWNFLPFPQELYDYYCSQTQIDTVRVLTFDLPFTAEKIPLEKVKFIETNEVALTGSGDTAWDHEVESPSNLVNDLGDHEKPYKMYYTGVGRDLTGIGLAYSEDGRTWFKESEPVLTGYSEPYVVQDGGIYRLFCERQSDDSIVSFTSVDGIEWGEETLIELAQLGDYAVHRYESPVAWLEEGEWFLALTESGIGDVDYVNEPVVFVSHDSVNWDRNVTGGWTLKVDSGRRFKLRRLLLTDVARVGDGYMFLGRFLAENEESEYQWRTGSLYLNSLESRVATVRSYVYKDCAEGSTLVESVNFMDTPNGSGFYYTSRDRITLGAASDHYGVPERLITKP
ncbi:hypothetical protein JXL21_12975 [Candidatus Bathyarchaeota archaeon]|nr:hypothetical protein [Candidatus Bathyarchaeota archaeon]